MVRLELDMHIINDLKVGQGHLDIWYEFWCNVGPRPTKTKAPAPLVSLELDMHIINEVLENKVKGHSKN